MHATNGPEPTDAGRTLTRPRRGRWLGRTFRKRLHQPTVDQVMHGLADDPIDRCQPFGMYVHDVRLIAKGERLQPADRDTYQLVIVEKAEQRKFTKHLGRGANQSRIGAPSQGAKSWGTMLATLLRLPRRTLGVAHRQSAEGRGSRGFGEPSGCGESWRPGDGRHRQRRFLPRREAKISTFVPAGRTSRRSRAPSPVNHRSNTDG